MLAVFQFRSTPSANCTDHFTLVVELQRPWKPLEMFGPKNGTTFSHQVCKNSSLFLLLLLRTGYWQLPRSKGMGTDESPANSLFLKRRLKDG
jgi:hypothetical protein